MSELWIRRETEQDAPAVRHVNKQAFGQAAEAELVDALRKSGAVLLSLVAERRGVIVGHILFSSVQVVGREVETDAVALAPIGVLPDHQRQGVGSALVRQGLATLREAGHGMVIVLGDAAYYPRFGFVPASRYGVRCPFKAPDEAFMAIELHEAAAPPGGGVLRYHKAFEALE